MLMTMPEFPDAEAPHTTASPAGPPADAEEGAARVRALLVRTFDRKDGTGADWLLMLESLYRAGFKIADERPDDEARRSIMRRVHEGAEVRLTGGYADGASNSDPAGPVPAPSNTGVFNSPGPRPPR
jgi:hypothetical protein